MIFMELICNELSFSACYEDKLAACEGFKNLIKTTKVLAQLGFDNVFLTTREFHMLDLCPGGYSVSTLMRDKAVVDRDELRMFIINLTKHSFSIEDKLAKIYIDPSTEYTFNGEPALGLTLACLSDSICLSLDGDGRFNNDNEITFNLTKAVMDIEGNIEEHTCEVHSLCKVPQVQEHRGLIKQKLHKQIRNGSDIIECAKKYFPNLQFCKNAKEQIKNLKGSESYFQQIIKHFDVFNAEAVARSLSSKGSSDRGFDPQGITYKARESSSTMNNPKCKDARTFKCPNGEFRKFWAHSWIDHGNRIHIIPDYDVSEEEGKHDLKVLIGYVGDHLPLSSD